MSKTNQNFSFYRGESRTVFIDLNNADGTPMDLTGCGVRWWLAKSPYSIIDDDDGVLVEKSLDDGIAVVAGGVNVSLSAGDTWIDPNIYYHELKVFLPGGGESMTCTGAVVIRAAADMRPRPTITADAVVVSGSGTVT